MRQLNADNLKRYAKRLGFYVKGAFLIGTRTSDVVSGVVIDRAPSSTYLWSFLIPAFDELTFLHMSLGRRSAILSDSRDDIEKNIMDAWTPISHVKRAADLLLYLETERIEGEYATWAEFLCLARCEKYGEAEAMLGIIETLKTANIPDKFKELNEAISDGGWPEVQKVFETWSCKTEKLISDIPIEI